MRLQLEHEVMLLEQIAEGDSRCRKEGLCPSLVRVRLRGLLIMRRRLEVSSIGCQKTRMLGIEILEATEEDFLLMYLKRADCQ